MKDPQNPSKDRPPLLLIIDRSPVFAEGLKGVASASGITLNAIFTVVPADAQRLLHSLATHVQPPGVVLMDGRIHPEFDCVDMLVRIRETHPQCEGILVLKVLDHFLLRKAIGASINVMLHREDSLDVFRHAIDAALSRSTYFSNSVARGIENSITRDRWIHREALSSRELDVLIRIGIGRPGNAIAGELGLSPKTVGTYRMRILQKLGLQSNADICFFCLRHFPDLLATHLGYHPGIREIETGIVHPATPPSGAI